MTKSVAFKVPQSKLAPSADAWINNRDTTDRGEGAVTILSSGAKAPREKMTRFTLDVAEPLHRRIKVACAERGQSIADVMRDVLEREFPVQS